MRHKFPGLYCRPLVPGATSGAESTRDHGTPPYHPRDLTDDQWEILEPFLSVPPRRHDGGGRPWKESRVVLNGIL